jgi:hypothetical protein
MWGAPVGGAAMKPDWLPDWKDPKAYPKPNDRSLKQWAWQFLRRNPEYQADYKRWRELLDSLGERETLPNIEEDMRFFQLDPPPKDGESYVDYCKRGGVPLYKPLYYELSEVKYGFRNSYMSRPGELRWASVGPWPPEYDKFYGWFKTAVISYLDWVPGRPGEPVGGPYEFEVMIRFKLEWPIDIQLRRAKEILYRQRSYHKEHSGLETIEKRIHSAKFPEYLRLLDAEVSGADFKAMARVLLPKKVNDYPDYNASKTIRNRLTAAKKLRDQDYLFIPLAGREK